jgi:hypothetical protein
MVQIAKHTQAGVRQIAITANHDQTPAYYDQVVGDVILLGTPSDAAVATAPMGPMAALPSSAPAARAQDSPSEPINAPLAAFSRFNGGWQVNLSFVEPTAVISYRLGDSGNFRETGFLDVLDPQTRKRMPNSSFQLAANQGTTTIYVRYVDRLGAEVGPFPIAFDPVAALERDYRKILEMTASNWLQFRQFNGLLVYYTHLVTYRCAIREVRIGIDNQIPDKVLPLPACDIGDPSSIPSNSQLYVKLPATTKMITAELTYRDGSVSELKTFSSAAARP